MIHRDTSIEAYHRIRDEGLLSERRLQVYECLFDVGPATGGEVFKEMKRRYGILVPTNSNTTTRLGELRAMGVARELGTRVCSVSDQRVILWDVTSGIPSPLVKPKSDFQKLQEYRKLTQRLVDYFGKQNALAIKAHLEKRVQEIEGCETQV